MFDHFIGAFYQSGQMAVHVILSSLSDVVSQDRISLLVEPPLHSKAIQVKVYTYSNKAALGLLFFINCFTDIFTEDVETEGEIRIKIKYVTST